MQLIQHYLTKNPCYVANVKKQDSRYVKFQEEGPHGLMLHSVGCAQPDAMSFIKRWDSPSYDNICVHGFIDANTGVIYQTLPWNFRAWHCGGSGNNTHIGVEMCESKWIHYTTGAKFTVLDKVKAQADATRAYNSAVELFAMLCKEYKLNPLKDICSHNEGGKNGIASKHVDPEHYWTGLGLPYTMDGFRNDVKSTMEGGIDMTEAELNALLDAKFAKMATALSESYNLELNAALETIDNHITAKILSALGPYIHNVDEIQIKSIRDEVQKLLDCDVINGGTIREENAKDVNMHQELLRVAIVNSRYADLVGKNVSDQILFTAKKEEDHASEN